MTVEDQVVGHHGHLGRASAEYLAKSAMSVGDAPAVLETDPQCLLRCLTTPVPAAAVVAAAAVSDLLHQDLHLGQLLLPFGG